MRETTTLDVANPKGTYPCPSQRQQRRECALRTTRYGDQVVFFGEQRDGLSKG